MLTVLAKLTLSWMISSPSRNTAICFQLKEAFFRYLQSGPLGKSGSKVSQELWLPSASFRFTVDAIDC